MQSINDILYRTYAKRKKTCHIAFNFHKIIIMEYTNSGILCLYMLDKENRKKFSFGLTTFGNILNKIINLNLSTYV